MSLVDFVALQIPNGSTAAQPAHVLLWVPVVALVVSVVSLSMSGITGYFQWRAHRAKTAVVGITLSNPPPYADSQGRTRVVVKNVGTAATSRKLEITLACSWLPLISYRLNLPTARYCLDVNEDYWWDVRLNEDVAPNSTIRVTVWDSRKDHWERVLVLNTPTNVGAQPDQAA